MDSIDFAITSVEIGLLFRLDQKLSKEEKRELNNRNHTLGTIIRLSRSKEIIGTKIEENIDHLLTASARARDQNRSIIKSLHNITVTFRKRCWGWDKSTDLLVNLSPYLFYVHT